MIKRRIFGKNGMTLMELMIVVALVAVIAAVGYNALYFGLKSYSVAQKKWEAEVAVRYTAELLNKELGLSSFIDIRNSPAANWYTSPSYQYIFVSGGKVMYQNSTASATPIVALQNGQMSIEFTKPPNTADANKPIANTLSYKVIAKDSNGAELYSLSSTVMLKNFLLGTKIPNDSLFLTSSVDIPGNGIKYWSDRQGIFPRYPATAYSCGCSCFGCIYLSDPGTTTGTPN